MKIATLVFGGAEMTLGMRIVTDAVLDAVPHAEIVTATSRSAHDCDVLLVSLYWWRDVYAYLRWLNETGLDPRKRKPIIVIGGMSAVSYRPLLQYFHYAAMGDGEVIAPQLIKALDAGEDVPDIDGLIDARDPDKKATLAACPRLSAKRYIDLRQSKVMRIEIARGCKAKCPFCSLSYMKPYRELSADIVQRLLVGAQTKRVALFAPDSSVHSGIKQIEEALKKYGKQNLASDMRLEMLMKRDTADKVRFGVEAFGSATRKKFHKVPNNEILLKGLRHVAENVKTIKGKGISCGTMYLIGDIPGETGDDVKEFWDVMQQFDDALRKKFTMFVSVASFMPSPFTPMERCRINPWTKVNDWFAASRPHFRNLVIATRGGVIKPHVRLAQMLTVRGDESCGRLLNWIATKGTSILTAGDALAMNKFESACKAARFSINKLIDHRCDELPWHNIESPIKIPQSMIADWDEQ